MGRNGALKFEEWRPRWPPLRVQSTKLVDRNFKALLPGTMEKPFEEASHRAEAGLEHPPDCHS